MYRLNENFSCECVKSYNAKGNRFLCSMQSNLALHDVNPITAIDGWRKAIYIGVTASEDIWAPIRNRKLARITQNRYVPSFSEKVIPKIVR